MNEKKNFNPFKEILFCNEKLELLGSLYVLVKLLTFDFLPDFASDSWDQATWQPRGVSGTCLRFSISLPLSFPPTHGKEFFYYINISNKNNWFIMPQKRLGWTLTEQLKVKQVRKSQTTTCFMYLIVKKGELYRWQISMVNKILNQRAKA